MNPALQTLLASSPAPWHPIAEPVPPDAPLYWLALQRIEMIGPIRAQALLEAFGSPEGIFRASGQELSQVQPHLAEGIVRAILRGPDLDWARQQASKADSLGASILHLQHPEYPECLRRISSPPPILFVQGTIPLLHPRAVAMVGTRMPCQLGYETARTFARHWSRCGLRIVSGLARGIDEEAHRTTLECGGETVAVLGCPLDGLGTRGRGKLAQDISTQGLLVSEHAFEAPVKPGNFVRRNRLIAGLSQATVVIQAPNGSGALITARFALDQDRELFAAPGPVGGDSWEGNFDLLRQGAHLCASPEDLLVTMGWSRPHLPNASESDSPVVRLLRRGEASAEEIALQLKLPMNRLQGELVLLELSGAVSRVGGGRFSIAP